jgi:hypothetical protein
LIDTFDLPAPERLTRDFEGGLVAAHARRFTAGEKDRAVAHR